MRQRRGVVATDPSPDIALLALHFKLAKRLCDRGILIFNLALSCTTIYSPSLLAMDKQLQLHQLRVEFIALNMEYTKRIREGESFNDLEFLNSQINELVTRIQALEKELGLQ
jgi:hypothetical protein